MAQRKRAGHYTWGGKQKVRYTQDAAAAAAERINAENDTKIADVYVCSWCDSFHVGRGVTKKQRSQERIIHRWDSMMIELGARATGCIAQENGRHGRSAILQRFRARAERLLLEQPRTKGSIKGI